MLGSITSHKRKRLFFLKKKGGPTFLAHLGRSARISIGTEAAAAPQALQAPQPGLRNVGKCHLDWMSCTKSYMSLRTIKSYRRRLAGSKIKIQNAKSVLN
jgi:hypothetical protein